MKKIFIVFMLMFSINAFSQPEMEDGDATNLPVDGGLSLLLAAGAAYGIRQIRSRRGQKGDLHNVAKKRVVRKKM